MAERAAGSSGRRINNERQATLRTLISLLVLGLALPAWSPSSSPIAPAAESRPPPALKRAPAFFLDCADFFHEQGETGRALQVLSNIAELELENPALLRVLAHRLAQWEQLDLAALMFAEVLELRPEYQVKTHFFGSTALQLTGAVTLQVEIFTRYGRPDEQRRSITLRLNQTEESLMVGEIAF